MQKAVNEVENWANSWGFRFSVAKTSNMFFSKKKNNPSLIGWNGGLLVKMYGYQLEQVNVVRFLGMWMDSKFNLEYIQNIEMQKDNVLWCVRSWWGKLSVIKNNLLCCD